MRQFLIVFGVVLFGVCLADQGPLDNDNPNSVLNYGFSRNTGPVVRQNTVPERRPHISPPDEIREKPYESAFGSPPSIRPQPPAPPKPEQLAEYMADSNVDGESGQFGRVPIRPFGPFGRHGSLGRQRRPARRFNDDDICNQWEEWEESKCFWPAKDPFSQLPKACQYTPTPEDMPAVLKSFLQSKGVEEFDKMSAEFKNRNAMKPCGMCARKYRCRVRNQTSDMPPFCAPQQISYVRDPTCDVVEPCQISVVDGGCPPPRFYNSHKPINNREQMVVISRRVKREAELEAQSSDFKSIDGEKQFVKQKIEEKLTEMFNSSVSDELPVWNCIKNKANTKCLCCCDLYFPDAETENCISIVDDLIQLVTNKTQSMLASFQPPPPPPPGVPPMDLTMMD